MQWCKQTIKMQQVYSIEMTGFVRFGEQPIPYKCTWPVREYVQRAERFSNLRNRKKISVCVLLYRKD